MSLDAAMPLGIEKYAIQTVVYLPMHYCLTASMLPSSETSMLKDEMWYIEMYVILFM